MRCAREFAPSFRGVPLPASSTQGSVTVRCRCGAAAGQLEHSVALAAPVVRCHCERCRRFHTSSMAALLCVPLDEAPPSLLASRSFADTCGGLGAVERLFCGTCRSSLGMRAADGVYFGLGCVDDSTLDSALALRWRTESREQCTESAVPWWTARPGNAARRPAAPRLLRGGCLCGGCRFEAVSGSEFQLQHCYCGVCRYLSGSLCQTWVPVRPDGFQWTSQVSAVLSAHAVVSAVVSADAV